MRTSRKRDTKSTSLPTDRAEIVAVQIEELRKSASHIPLTPPPTPPPAAVIVETPPVRKRFPRVPRSTNGLQTRKDPANGFPGQKGTNNGAVPLNQKLDEEAVERTALELGALNSRFEHALSELAEPTRRLEVLRQNLGEAELELEEMKWRRELVRQEVDQETKRREALGKELTEAETELHELRRQVEAVREQIAAQVAVLRESCLSAETLLQESRQQIQLITTEARESADRMLEVRHDLENRTQALKYASGAAGSATSPQQSPREEVTLTDDQKGQLGVTVDAEVVVVHILPNSPAERAGLCLKDRITAVDSHPVTNGEALRRAVSGAESYKDIVLTVMRGEVMELIPVHFEDGLPSASERLRTETAPEGEESTAD